MKLANGRKPGRRTILLFDQVLSSASNYGLSLVVARQTSAGEFGRFSLVYLCALLITGLQRGMVFEPVLASDGSDERVHRMKIASAAFGAAVAMASIGAAVLSGPTYQGIGVLMAVLLVPLLATDRARYVAFLRDPSRALLIDALWLAIQAGGFIVLVLVGADQSAPYLAVWGIGAGVALLCSGHVRVARPDLAGLKAWFRNDLRRSIGFAIDFLLSQGVSLTAVIGVGAVAGKEIAGALRAGQLTGGPIIVALAVVPIILLPRIRAQPAKAVRLVVEFAVLAAIASVAWFGLLIVVGVDGLRHILGDSASAVAPLLPQFMLYFILVCIGIPVASGVKSLGTARHFVTARLIAVPASLAVIPVVALWPSANAAAWALVGAGVASAVIWSGIFPWALRGGASDAHRTTGT